MTCVIKFPAPSGFQLFNPNSSNTYKLEADTERRALEMLKEWNLYDDSAKERSDKYLRTLA